MVSPTNTGQPSMDSESRARLRSVQDAFAQLEKSIKNINLYRHNTARYAEYLARPLEAFWGYTEAFGPLVVKVEAGQLLFEKVPVFDLSIGSDSIPYRFFRDGIRQLVFRPGLTAEELQEFVLVCMADLNSSENLGKDMAALMWEARFESIEYVALEGFALDDVSEEEVKVEVDAIIGYLQGRLKSRSDDYLRFARLSAEDIDARLEQVDQLRGLIVAGQPCSPEKAAAIQEEIRLDEKERLLPKLVNIVFQVIDVVGDELGNDAIQSVLTQLLDAMLLHEDFTAISHIVSKLKSLERDPRRGLRFERIRESFSERMGEAERLDKVGEILNSSRPRSTKDIHRYLVNLEETALVPLLDLLDRVEIPEHRKLVCDAIVTIRPERPEPFLRRLESDRSRLVRDMIYIIDQLGFPERSKMFARALSNSNMAVRLEALAIIARSRSEDCRQLVAESLRDPSKDLRLQAARLLTEYDATKAHGELMRIIESPEFTTRELKEKLELFSILGSTQQEHALSFFATLLKQKSFFQKRKIVEDKLLAVAGLSNLASLPSFKLLQAEAENESNPEEVRFAAKRGMLEVRATLFGERDQHEEDGS